MEDLGPPVYEADQVITMADLNKFRAQCMLIHHLLPWWRRKAKSSARTTIIFIEELQDWVGRGKPDVMMMPADFRPGGRI
jgi:hypothetical protein